MNDSNASSGNDQFGAERGNPLGGQFGGIIEGPWEDRAALESAVAELNAVELVSLELELDGARFGLLPHDGLIPGDRLTLERKARFVEALEKLYAVASSGRPIESTLHCREQHADAIVETYFAAESGKLRVLSRERPVSASDQTPPPAEGVSGRLRKIGLPQMALITVGLVFAFSILVWREGLLDRALTPAASAIEVEYGGYEGCLEVEVERSWGQYEVTIRRGPKYPTTLEAATVWEESAQSLEARARRKAVTSGATVQVELRNKDGKALASAETSFAALLEDPDATIEVEIPGRIGTRSVAFSLSKSKP